MPITYTGDGQELGTKFITQNFEAKKVSIYDMIESLVAQHPDVRSEATRLVTSMQELKAIKES